ncbi:SurA N-terminal domain-containing protein [Paenibacillus provencensis]|uniref:SurA N-terminal domain-containing protein n=1 Tax=Paenibacillus provencensis TaxID=441151 RepID=A0ABW3PVX6_9BACL|nr:SurA N-terminal domain-containing protein [Paenibacillus sp. MER 78]MCM3130371.1 SurA N-terminal domain-containing protein [Paenibacillus sp. MER 78]
MKKKYLLIPAAGVCVLAMTLSIVSASSSNSNSELISQSFDEMKVTIDKIGAVQNQNLASFDTLKVDVEDFVFYKANAQLVAELKNTEVPSDQSLIDNMLKDKLTAYEAIQQGITVSDEEVQKEIDFQRDVFENQMDLSSPEVQDVYDMMKNRIRIIGLSEEEFWKADFVKQGYKEALLEGKLMNSLRGDDRTFETIEDFQKYKEELLTKYKDKISLNLDLLNNI